MKSPFLWQLGLVAAIGCSGQPGPVAAPAPESTTTAASQPEDTSTPTEGADGLTLVSLNVPNMH